MFSIFPCVVAKFPMFSLSGKIDIQIPCFPSAMATLMILDGKILRGLFKHEGLKPANIRRSQGNVQNLAQLK